VVLLAGYSAFLISFLATRETKEFPFTSFKQFLDDGRYQLGMISDSAFTFYFEVRIITVERYVAHHVVTKRASQFMILGPVFIWRTKYQVAVSMWSCCQLICIPNVEACSCKLEATRLHSTMSGVVIIWLYSPNNVWYRHHMTLQPKQCLVPSSYGSTAQTMSGIVVIWLYSPNNVWYSGRKIIVSFVDL
jgi:hypothetical protein